ncbi:hypothetical protein TVAG_121140 [Trichomonas vaginalis G3]|uniref:Elongator complex protein 2 n=1 Tax=Trichomonas vaginalis (strain ATCC PRA-98 / G3) TaxID=412133 RepID=A2D7Q9_TRIV3|nr:elongator complex protein family [Trichomonas vaginalis G3]EAY23776.1 hypothetical protein TVAG_121140 [Trichomonas vaginalis G3]KAI5490289.1 elongator complex protein family [Trichomonas vaginalis G3]|eukprot:XP_001277024.1 hypothetical protein [Trichomonas vaginalis G3]
MQAFGGVNSDPDSWDAQSTVLAYGSGSCVLVQSLTNYLTIKYIPLHNGVITCVKFTTDGNIVVGTSDGNIMLFDPTTGEKFDEKKFKSSIHRLAVSQNYVFISTALDGTYLLKLQDNKFVETKYETPNIHSVGIAILEVYDSFILAVAHPDGPIHLLVPDTKSEVILQGNAWCQSLKFAINAQDQILFASGCQDRAIRVWKILPYDASQLTNLGISIDTQSILHFQNQDLNVSLQSVLSGHTDWVNGVDLYKGETLCSVSFDGQVLLWTANSEDYDVSLRLGSTAVTDDQSGMIACRLIGPRDIISNSRNGTFSHWVDGKPVRCFSGHFESVSSVAWSNEGFFLSTGLDKVARVWGEIDGAFVELARPLIHGHTIHDCAQIDVDKFGFCSDEKQIRVLQPTSNFAKLVGEPLSKMELPFASMVQPLNLSNKILQTYQSVAIDFAPLNGADFEFDGIPPGTSMWLTRWPEVQQYWKHFRELTRIAVGKAWIASGDDRGGVVVRTRGDETQRRFNSGTPAGDVTVGKEKITGLAAAPDDTAVVASTINGVIRVFDAESGNVLTRVELGIPAYAVGWDESSGYFIVGHENGISVYERDGKLAATENCGAVTALDVLPGFNFVLGFKDGKIRKSSYNSSTKKIEIGEELQCHSERVNMIRVNKDQTKVISGSEDHTILLQPYSN